MSDDGGLLELENELLRRQLQHYWSGLCAALDKLSDGDVAGAESILRAAIGRAQAEGVES